MERRTVLKLLAGGMAAPNLPRLAGQQHSRRVQIVTKPPPYAMLVVSDEENALLDRLSEMIIPADERSGGAHDAKVSLYSDWVVGHSEISVQDTWHSRLKAVDEEAQRRFGKTFLKCDAASRDTLMAEWAGNEKDRKTELKNFFGLLKRTTAAGYYTSEIGLLKELGYQGNAYLSEFPGCTQPCNFCNSK